MWQVGRPQNLFFFFFPFFFPFFIRNDEILNTHKKKGAKKKSFPPFFHSVNTKVL